MNLITNIIKIGNSKGIRIPSTLLKESGLLKEVELKVKKGEIKIVSAEKRKLNPDTVISEKALSDWSRKEEAEAWKNLK